MNSSNNYNRVTFNIIDGESLGTNSTTISTVSGSGVDVLPPIMGAFRTKVADNNIATFNIKLPDENFNVKSVYSYLEIKGTVAKENEQGSLTSEGFHYTTFKDQPYFSLFSGPGSTSYTTPGGGSFPIIQPTQQGVLSSITIGQLSGNSISITLANIPSSFNATSLESYRMKGLYLLM